MQSGSFITILDNLTLIFYQNASYAITGVSGAGKTTLLHIIAGLQRPDSGTVSTDTLVLNDLSQKEKTVFLNQTIGIMFQSPFLIHELSIEENCMLPALIAGKSYTYCREWVKELLAMVGLYSKINSRPSELSGGQQQRAALARALCNKPQFLLADEPTGNLDPKTGAEIIELLLMCQAQWGMGVIVSTHDQKLITTVDHIYQLSNAMVTEQKN